MTLPSITAPVGTPVFLAEGHGIQESPVFADVRPGTGHARRRRVWTVPTRTVSVRWLLDAADLQAVDQWYEDTLQAGALPWSAQVANDQGAGLVWWAARWVEFGIELLHYGRGIVSGTLLLIGEPSTVPPETGRLGMALRARLLDVRSSVFLLPALDMELTAALVQPAVLRMEVSAPLLSVTDESRITEAEEFRLTEDGGEVRRLLEQTA